MLWVGQAKEMMHKINVDTTGIDNIILQMIREEFVNDHP